MSKIKLIKLHFKSPVVQPIFKCEIIKVMIDKDICKTFVYTDTHTHIHTTHMYEN